MPIPDGRADVLQQLKKAMPEVSLSQNPNRQSSDGPGVLRRSPAVGVGLNHMPSGRFGANAAWLAINVIAHNLARWATRIGQGEGIVTTETLRRRSSSVPGLDLTDRQVHIDNQVRVGLHR